jgi:hypothetical protein
MDHSAIYLELPERNGIAPGATLTAPLANGNTECAY